MAVGLPLPPFFRKEGGAVIWGVCARTVIDIHFFSIRSLTFYFSIPIISIRL